MIRYWQKSERIFVLNTERIISKEPLFLYRTLIIYSIYRCLFHQDLKDTDLKPYKSITEVLVSMTEKVKRLKYKSR